MKEKIAKAANSSGKRDWHTAYVLNRLRSEFMEVKKYQKKSMVEDILTDRLMSDFCLHRAGGHCVWRTTEL